MSRPEEDEQSQQDNTAEVSEEQQQEQAPEERQTNAPAAQDNTDDPLGYIDWNRHMSSRTKTVEDGMTEAGKLIQLGWRPSHFYTNKKSPNTEIMYMRAPTGSGRIFYTKGRNMDDDGAESLMGYFEEMHGSPAAGDASPAGDPPAAAAAKGGAAAAAAGSSGGRGGSSGGSSRPAGRPEDDPGHGLYPYLSKEEQSRSVVWDIMRNAKRYQSLTADLGWQAMVTILQVARFPPEELKERMLEYDKDPEKFKMFLLDQLESLLMAASKNGYDRIEDLKERIRVESAKVRLATGYVKELQHDLQVAQANTEDFRRNFNMALSMMDDGQVRRLANALAAYDVVSPEVEEAQAGQQQQVYYGRQQGSGGATGRPINHWNMGGSLGARR